MIIGLTGKKNSGKDTVAAYLMQKHRFERRAFADKLKESVAALFDIPVSQIETYKNDSACYASVGFYNEPEQKFEGQPSGMWSPSEAMSFRSFLQRYGTEAHRNVFGMDFWLDHVLPLDGFYNGRKIVVTDCRFENEAQRIIDLNGIVLQIERRSLADDDTHESELPIPSYLLTGYLENSTSVEDLFEQVEDYLSGLTD